MKKHFFIVILALSTFGHRNIQASGNILHTFCCALFGNKEASTAIKSYFSQAESNFKLSNSIPIPIKYIKDNRFLNQFSAFTWFGTWVDRNYWSTINDTQKQWHAHHEVAHTALHHPEKQISMACFATITAYLATHILKLNRPLSALAITASLATIIPYYACACEKEADIAAANILCKNNKIDIVQAHVDELESQPNQSCIWFYEQNKQINYLKETIKEYSEPAK